MAKENLTPLQMVILERIVSNSITAISYYHPEIQIGKLIKGRKEIQEALQSFEYDFRIFAIDPALKFKRFKRKFWFWLKTRCGYRVDLKRAKELYGSLKSEKSNQN